MRNGMAARTVPDFVIIGMPKTATTSLYESLKEHPDLAACYWKEPAFWAEDIRAAEKACPGGEKRFAGFIETYEKYASAFPTTGVTFEASTHYVYSEVAPSRLRERNPRCRAILFVREPTEWVVSWYQNLLIDRFEDLPIEEAYARSASRSERDVPKNHQRLAVYDYKTMACPVEAIERWKTAFGDDLLVLTYAELTREWPETRKRILAHVGVADAELELFAVNQAKRGRMRTVSSTIERVFPIIQPIYSRVPRRLIMPARNAYQRAFYPKAKKPTWRPPKSDFRTAVERVGEITGIDLIERWNY